MLCIKNVVNQWKLSESLGSSGEKALRSERFEINRISFQRVEQLTSETFPTFWLEDVNQSYIEVKKALMILGFIGNAAIRVQRRIKNLPGRNLPNDIFTQSARLFGPEYYFGGSAKDNWHIPTKIPLPQGRTGASSQRGARIPPSELAAAPRRHIINYQESTNKIK